MEVGIVAAFLVLAISGLTARRGNAESAGEVNAPEWHDLETGEEEKLVAFVVAEIQKLKVEHQEIDDCYKLELASVLNGKKQLGKMTKYSVTLKVLPKVSEGDDCFQHNATLLNLNPEICEADVMEGENGDADQRTLLRSTCLQVEELQD